MRIGFLFNHDQIHQVAHSLPIAFELARLRPDAEILIAATNARIAQEILRLTANRDVSSLSFVGLGVHAKGSRLLSRLLGKFVPAAKLLVYRDNLDFFRSLDALVVTERTSLILKTRYRVERPMMILSDHGAGDRAIGFGTSASRFDHILAAGRKISDRLVSEAGVAPDRVTITGYPKFDGVGTAPRPPVFEDEGRLTVLYNPHVSPHLSSWYKQGRAVLDFFLERPEYNLIFAPHIMLFQRSAVLTIDKLSLGVPGDLACKYAAAPNIHIDIGSAALTDMSYIATADLYLGDVSSQVYEFLKHQRPTVFLNTHRVAYQSDPNYLHWRTGPVIESVSELGDAIERAVADHESHFRPIQKSLFEYTFDLQDEPSARRSARTVISLLSDIDRRERKGADVG